MENIIEDVWGAEYANGIIPFFHKDSNGNIVSKKVTGGTYTVKNGVIVLEEYPDLQYGLTINKLNGASLSRVEKSYSALNENEYIVDVVTGFIHFHPSLEGSQVKVDDYFGKGQWLITDKRIIADIVKDSNGNYDYKTLAETIAGAKGFISKGEWNRETAYDMNNIVVYNGVIYISKQTDEKNKGKEPGEDSDYWDVVINVNGIIRDDINKHSEITATSSKLGHVKLSDSITSLSDASSGGTAATPKAINNAVNYINNKKADKKNSNNGFEGGNNSEASDGAAIGDGAHATSGGAVGQYAESTSGGAIGAGANATSGGAVGIISSATTGGALGDAASATTGGAVGNYAGTTEGGAIGLRAKTGNGFAGGRDACTITYDESREEIYIDAIQLGTGTNSTEKTLQVYDYTLMNADGTIPSERLNNVTLSKGQVGLGNVDNTSDLNKPISIAMQKALDRKLNVTQYSNKDLNEITVDGVYELSYSNTQNFDKSLYNLPDGYDTIDTYLGFGSHDMYLIVTSTNLTDDSPVDAKKVYYGIQFLYTKDGMFFRTIEKHAQTNDSYYFDSWLNTEDNIENHTLNTSNPHSVTKEQVGLGNVENKSSATIRSEITKDNVTTALGYTPTEANIKKNPNATDGDIVDKHLTVGVREGTAGNYSFVSGGDGAYENEASGVSSAAVGGMDNHATALSAFIGGGGLNKAYAGYSAIVGGFGNTISNIDNHSIILGGQNNTIIGDSPSGYPAINSGIFAGINNKIQDDCNSSVILGGCDNWISNIGTATSSAILGGYHAKAYDYNTVVGRYNKDPDSGGTKGTYGDAFIVGIGDSTARKNGFRVAYDGNCYAATAMNSTGADYAECFEWTDGNPDNEDRIGFMTAFDGDKIRFANENDPVEIIGVVSAIPAIVGDNYADEWCGKYLKDKYGRLLTEHKVYEAEYRDVEEYEEIELTAEEISEMHEKITNDETLTDDEKAVKLLEIHTTKTVKVTKQELVHKAYEADEYVLNPDYNADEEYIPRLKRKEYSAVGTHGKLVVRDDGTCEVGGFCRSGNGGIATKSDSGFYVMERIDDETVRIYIK